MNVNDLKELVELWKYDRSDNIGGTPIEQFKLYRKIYASVKVRGGGTDQTDIGKLPNTNVEFVIRYDPVVDYRVQIKYNSKFYEIYHIELVDREAWMRIKTVVYNELT